MCSSYEFRVSDHVVNSCYFDKRKEMLSIKSEKRVGKVLRQKSKNEDIKKRIGKKQYDNG